MTGHARNTTSIGFSARDPCSKNPSTATHCNSAKFLLLRWCAAGAKADANGGLYGGRASGLRRVWAAAQQAATGTGARTVPCLLLLLQTETVTLFISRRYGLSLCSKWSSLAQVLIFIEILLRADAFRSSKSSLLRSSSTSRKRVSNRPIVASFPS